ncbi:MAG: homocysteine S-methyltransferase family protein, partial [Prevotella sp.]|nr:homocysteine S-methyltransferase family protein [Prevotella sp.]
MMRERILILDGATGTYLQQHFPEETKAEAKGCNDYLCLARPDLIKKMHQDYIAAGADIIETNSFNSNRFSLADYGLQDKVYEINKAAARIAREAADSPLTPLLKRGEQLQNTPSSLSQEDNGYSSPLSKRGVRGESILVAGSMGPTSKTTSISADVNDPGAREVTFQDLYETYHEQARGLIDGGADILLVETIFDTLNAKAALKAITDLGEEMGIDIPIMVSGTLSDASGRTLSGQTVEAYYASLSHPNLLSIGLNCGFGAKQLLPWLRRLAEIAECAVSVHPNAGLPNVMGGYDETPETFAQTAKEVFEAGLVNIYGGCCGTTPEHIRSLKGTLTGTLTGTYTPRPLREGKRRVLRLSGLEELVIDHSTFINVGERTNVAGSAKFKKLIQAKDYEAALSVARQQVENGAQVIDICMDDGLIDGVEAMTTFLNLIASEPEIARVPVMIDSSKWEILKAGLQCVQGKSIVNSISLKEGEEKFLEKARHIHSMGAATVVMLFDEEGQADTYERKVSVARRAYKLLKGIGFPTEDIIFDPNVLAVATGMPEHDDYARAFIEACRTIHEEMPEVHMSGGISNLSFSFRGNNTIRQAMHSVFLYHAMQAGLDMSIVNPAMTTIYSDIPQDMLQVVEDVILNKKTPSNSPLKGENSTP